ncbi:hypothetical protein V5O48_018868 [Marasmius crinis-equi]|uniref:Uncharacterized protein n=1 Tax=Marasmius crinis-equi TaxID=585013 RepID=A0ABR3EJY9_9AGAR
MGQYGSRSPEVPKSSTKHVASTSAASTKAKAKSSAVAPAPSSSSRSRPQPSRPVAPVAGSSRRPAVSDVPLEISDDEPTAELPPKQKAAKRRAPPPVVDEDADYNPEVDTHDDIQEEIREVPPPRPAEQQMVFSDDEREGVPLHRAYVLVPPMPLQPLVIKADVQGKLRGAQEFGEASELALLGRDGRSCSFWRIARSHRACGAHIPGARCTNCDNRRNNLCDVRASVKQLPGGRTRTYYECTNCAKSKLTCSLSYNLEAFAPWRASLTESAIRHPSLVRRALNSVLELHSSHQQLVEASQAQAAAAVSLETQLTQAEDFLRLVGRDPQIVCGVVAADTKEELTDEHYKILANIFDWPTVPDVSDCHIVEDEQGQILLRRNVGFEVVARAGPTLSTPAAANPAASLFNEDVVVENAEEAQVAQDLAPRTDPTSTAAASVDDLARNPSPSASRVPTPRPTSMIDDEAQEDNDEVSPKGSEEESSEEEDNEGAGESSRRQEAPSRKRKVRSESPAPAPRSSPGLLQRRQSGGSKIKPPKVNDPPLSAIAAYRAKKLAEQRARPEPGPSTSTRSSRPGARDRKLLKAEGVAAKPKGAQGGKKRN